MAFNTTPVYVGPLVGGDVGSPNQGNSQYVQRTALASRPAVGNKGVFFIASDDANGERLYWDDGAAWVDLGLITQATPVKRPVLVATTANIALSGEQTIDGVLTSASRVLVKNQTTGSENGIYVSAAGAWTRATDTDTSAKVISGIQVAVSQGTVGLDTVWILTTNDPITLGTTALIFAKGGAAEATQAEIEGESAVAAYVPPDLVKNSPGVAKAWCLITPAGTLQSPDYNVSTVTDTGTGNRTINFSVAFSIAVYSATSSECEDLSVNTIVVVLHLSFATGSIVSKLYSTDGLVLTDRSGGHSFYGGQ